MRILFVRPYPVIPESYAGTQITLHWLCRKLKAHGHEIAIAATTRLAPGEPAKLDRACGYPVFRAEDIIAAARSATANVQPDVVVVTQAGHWLELLPPAILNAPLVLYEHEISNALARISPEIKARASFIANSAVTSAHLAKTVLKALSSRPFSGSSNLSASNAKATMFFSSRCSGAKGLTSPLESPTPGPR
jgi:hypothetical protein